MYRHVYVPVDNSAHSNRAIDCAVALGRAFAAKLTGCHVYAAKMHDYRFKQMEFTLPEEYLVESELARQRKIHDSLITMGLELVSDCYLESMERLCRDAGVECAKKRMDGKHSTEIVKDIEASDYDLVVLGALGIGRTKDSQIGSVCARVTREVGRDTWVVKHLPKEGEPERDAILVGVDGSPQSFGALMTAVELARRFGKRVEAVGVYDPYLHYAVFKGIVEVLTDKAAKVFRFEEQNQLHEEIIDTGLAQIYQSHVNVAATMAREAGVEVTKTLLDGKAFQKVLDHARKVEPWLLVVGHLGIHAGEGETGLGSNTENLLRLAPCDVLLTSREVVPELDLKAEQSIHWTPEAEERMGRVPPQVKGIARTAILRLALEHGHSVVSSDLVTEAMERFMPKRSAEMTARLAEALAIDQARREAVSICRACGVAAKVPDPAVCTVCGAADFEVVEPEVLDRIAAGEGGVEEETTYDGRRLAWTQEAKKALRAIDDKYQRRRAKARIEKSAHGSRMNPITLEFAQRFIEEETGVLYKPAFAGGAGDAAAGAAAASTAGNGHGGANGDGGAGEANGHGSAGVAGGNGGAGRASAGAPPAAGANGHAEASTADDARAAVGAASTEAPTTAGPNLAAGAAGTAAAAGAAPDADRPELKILGRDAKGCPLISRLAWTADAVQRVLRVPSGFMRDKTQRRIEELAAERQAGTVDLQLVEDGIEIGKRLMAEMLGQYGGDGAAARAAAEAEGRGAGDGKAAAGGAEPAGAACPVPHDQRAAEPVRLALNEVSVMSALERERRRLGLDK